MADRSIVIRVGANVTGAVNGMRTLKGATEDFSKSAAKGFAKNRAQLDQLAGTATKVGLGLVAVAGFAVKSAMDWEQAWTGVLKTVDGTSSQLASLEDDLRSLAKETGFAHSEVAAVAEAAGQLGISTEGVSDFTETMLAMGVSTNLSAEEAATGLARFRNIMGSTEADIERMGSTIVGLGNNFATTEAEILAMSMRIAGAGRQAGLSEADVMGLSAAMSSVGIEAEAGGTAMSLTMKKIGGAVDSGSEKLGQFARIAGMSAEDFSRSWQNDAAGTLTTFVAGLDNASQSGESVNAILTELGVTGIREADALLRLSGNAAGLADALEQAGAEWEKNAALMSEADKFYNTTAQKGKQAWASIKDSAIDAGDALLPVVAGIFDAVGGLADAFGDLPGPVKSGVTAIAGVGGASLLAIAGLVKLAGAIQDTKAAYDALSISGGKSGRALATAGRVAAMAAIFYAAGELSTQHLKKSSEDISALSDSLVKFGKSGDVGGKLKDFFGEDFGGYKKGPIHAMHSLRKEIEEFGNYSGDNGFTKARRNLASLGTVGFDYDSVEKIKALDAAYAQLSARDPGAAIKSFERMRDLVVEQGGSIEDLNKAFPTMTGLLKDAAAVVGETGDATEILSGDLSTLAPAAQHSAEEMQKARDEAMQLGSAFLEPGKALEWSLGSWESKLKKQTEALRDFRKNAAEAIRNGASIPLVDYLVSKGPEGADMLRQLAKGSKEAAESMSEAFRGSNEELARFVAWQADLEDWTVVTEFKTAGDKDAIKTAFKVAKAADLNAQEVETILNALDYATPDIEKVLAKMRDADRTTATPTVNLKDNATPKLSGIGSQLSLLAGRAIDTYVNVIERKTKASANGNLFDSGRVRQFANGGIDEFGRPVQRVPQIRSGSQGTVMWGEPETGWEAYVSGKPSQKPRNRAILGEAAARLGGSVQWFADGGFKEAVTGLELTRMRIRVRDLSRALKETEEYGKKPKGGGKRPKRLVLRGLDRREALQELREAEADLKEQQQIRRRMKKAGDKTSGQYNRRMKKAEDKADEAKRAAEDATENRKSVASSFADGLSGDSFKSPATLERALSNMLRDSSEFTGLLADLRKKGASPWLLEQLVKAGPSRATNRTARALLADSARLGRLNAMSSGIVTGANSYAALVTQPGFSATYSGAGPSAIGEAISIVKQAMESAQFSLTLGNQKFALAVQQANSYAGAHR